jgi:hypothetical protein
MRSAALLCLLLGPVAALAAQSPAERTYIAMKQDSDIYLGEGVAELKDFDGDKLKARSAAKERARGDLAANVSVEVKSLSSEKLESKDGKVSEELKSQSSSQADLKLDNVKYVELDEYPEPGQVTVLASLNKEDYRRQLAGKTTPVYRPEYGIKLDAWGLSLPSFNTIEDSGTNAANLPLAGGNGSSSNSNSNGATTGSTGDTPGIGMEFVWKDFSLGLDYYSKDMQVYLYHPSAGNYDRITDGLSLAMVSLGWQWIPWDWRVQPFFPVGLDGAFSDFNYFQAYGAGAFAGAGLRYWPSDSFSIELSWRYLQGFNDADYEKAGQPMLLRPGQQADFSLTGQQTRAAIQWSGF